MSLQVQNLDIFGGTEVDAAECVHRLENVDTDTLRELMYQQAESFKAHIEHWKTRIGAALWVLRSRLPDGEYGDVVAEFVVMTGFAERTVLEWRRGVEAIVGRPDRQNTRGRPVGVKGPEIPAEFAALAKLVSTTPEAFVKAGEPEAVALEIKRVETWLGKVKRALRGEPTVTKATVR